MPNLSSNLASAYTSKRRIAKACEVNSLVHVIDDIPSRTWMVCSLAACERFVWYAATTPLRKESKIYSLLVQTTKILLENYLQNAAGSGLPGALGFGESTATNIVNALMISVYLTPIPSALVADRYGRYKTMVWSAA